MSNSTPSNLHAPPHILIAKDWMIGLLLMIGSMIASVLLVITLLTRVPSEFQLIGALTMSGFGSLAVFWLYALVTDKSWSYLDIPDVSLRALALGLGVGLVLAAIQSGLTMVFISLDIGEPISRLGRLVQIRGVTFLVVLILANLLVIGPAEELLYRNGIQKLLYRSHSTAVAVLVAGAIFTLPHLLQLSSYTTPIVLKNFTEIFVNALVYGGVYAYWERVDITIVAHGVYNSIVFIFAYLQVFGV